MNYITKFNSQAAYDSAKSTLVKPNVSLVGGNVEYLPRNIEWGAFLHSDGTVDNTAKSDVIGICVIPSSHYGKARFMSVVKMSTSSTQGTTSNEGIKFWGSDDGFTTKYSTRFVGVDIQSYRNTRQLYDYNNDRYPYLLFDSINVYLEGDGYVDLSNIGIPAGGDTLAKYGYNDGDDTYRYIPSPFLANGKLNLDYAKSWPNIFSDVDGKTNTDAYLAKSESNHPAALACKNFNPGFGEWYLPAIGELAYIVPRANAIRQKLTQLSNAGCRVSMLTYDDYFWSSTACSPDSSWYVSMYDGNVYCDARDCDRYVLAFSAL